MGTEARFVMSFVRQHSAHPLGAASQRVLWPQMRPRGHAPPQCDVCRSLCEGAFLRCVVGCNWDLCLRCAEARRPPTEPAS